MSFFFPMAFFFALAALPIIGFYLLKVRQRKVTVPTLMFWNKVFEEKAPRSLFQKFRHPLSLLAQLVLLALLVLALADPTFSSTATGARKTIIIIDNSASMRASENGSSRLRIAQQKAHALVEGLRYFDTMAVIAAAGQPQIISGITDRQATLHQRIDAIAPSDGPTRLAHAVDLARTLLAGEPNPAIVLLSDGCFSPEILSQGDVTFVPVAPPSAKIQNVGITRFQVRRSVADPTSYDTFIQVQTFSPDAVRCNLEISLDAKLIDVIPLTLEPGKIWRQTITRSNLSPSQGQLTATLLHSDALDTDNHAFALVPPARRMRVDLHGSQSFFLRKAFESLPLVDITNQNPDLTVLHKTIPNPLPPGPLLILDPESSAPGLFTRSGALANPGIQPPSTTAISPLLANLQWQGVLLPQAQKLVPAPNANVLVTTLENDPLLFTATTPDGAKAVVFAGSLESGDFPLRTAFPILLANALNHFSGTSADFTPSPSTGDSLSLPRNSTSTPTLTDPHGTSHPLALTPHTITTPPLNRTGFWRLTLGSSDTLIPVNLADARESDLTPTPQAPTTQPSAQAPHTGAPLWFYLLAAGLAFITFEWYLYQRRWIT